MKKSFIRWNFRWLSAFAAIAMAGAATTSAEAAEERIVETVTATSGSGKSTEESPQKRERRIVIQKVETDDPIAKEGREVAWLGVSTEETEEALVSQLGLDPGKGLTVTYVAPDSPAAKAGLQKNDVLVELDGQLLVHPAQLRKLIQMHKEGDNVKLTVYHAGKKETVTATIGKMARGLNFLREEYNLQGDLHELQRNLKELQLNETAREAMRNARRALEQAGIDRESISKEVKRSMEEVRKSIQEALRQATNAHRTFGPAAREFRELARRGLDVEKDATVIVKSRHNSVKSIVKTDDSGTYVVVADPKKQLTAHDKSGKLLFDGPIETAEDQAKVPETVLEKVKPMLEQLNEDKAGSQKPEEDDTGI